jgi:rare lipoprotein A
VQEPYLETGLASWYGAPYQKRKAANGEIYDMNAMTAAHRTLPLNSMVRVTNPATGSSAVVRITDRGPFVQGRIIDLSLAAARKVDVWRKGTSPVKLELVSAPSPVVSGGRWCVQIGGFDHEKDARQLQDKISRRYHTARVLAFPSPVGPWWVRVRVLEDDKVRAQEVAEQAPAAQENIFLVRLD